MPRNDKTLDKMRRNPKGDFTIADLERVALRYGIAFRQPGSSHVTFSHPDWDGILTVPARRPIKPFYIKKFLDMVEEITDDQHE